MSLPLAPILNELGEVNVESPHGGYSWKNPNGFNNGIVQSCAMTVLAERAGVSRRTVQRWAVEGVPVKAADRLACALGLNPMSVWGESWDDADLH